MSSPSYSSGCLPNLPQVAVLALVFIFVIVLLGKGIAPVAVVFVLGGAVAGAIRFAQLGAATQRVSP